MLRNYFAGCETSSELVFDRLVPLFNYRLMSFYYLQNFTKENLERIFAYAKEHYKSFMLDSGAFSAHEQHEVIDFEAYLDFCWEYQDEFKYFVSLDTIPEDFRLTTLVDEAAEQSRNNYLDMVDFFKLNDMDATKIIPVYHQGEDPRYLRFMLDEKVPYIGLSPSNDVGVLKIDKERFLRGCFHQIRHSSHPNVKTHAFGLSSYELLGLNSERTAREFPFYSADATTWGRQALLSQIIVPKRKKRTKDGKDITGRHTFQAKWDFSDIVSIDIGGLAKFAERPAHFLAKDRYDDTKLSRKRIRDIIEYIRDFKLHIGYSTYRERHNREKQEDFEEPMDPRTQKSYFKKEYGGTIKDTILTEEAHNMNDGKPRFGLIHYSPWRMLINLVTVNNWVKTLDPHSVGDVEPELSPEDEKTREIVQHEIADRLNKKEMKKLPKFRRTK